MATIKEIADIVGVSSTAVSRVLNYDEGISVSNKTRKAIFDTAERLGYQKKVIYPKIENVALLFWPDSDDELEQIYYQEMKKELIKQAQKKNIHFAVIEGEKNIDAVPEKIDAFLAIGWLNRKEIDRLHQKCSRGVFIGTSPDEKYFDAVRPNFDSFVTQMVDYFVEKGYKKIGYIGGNDRNIDTELPSMDVREWSFRQSAGYYRLLQEEYIYITEGFTVAEGYRTMMQIPVDRLPDALCVASDTIAVGVLQAMNERGIAVPDRIAVFSINDINVAKYVSPPLTTIHIDLPVICETALDILRNKVLNGGKITKSVFVNGLPVFRKSC